MSTKLSFILIFVILVMACSSIDKPTKPENLIPKDKMTEVLYDMYIISGAKGVNRKLLETHGFIPETYVLTKHDIDSAQFAESNRYYAFVPKDYKDIVETVKARIEKEKEAFEELERQEDMAKKRRRDSLRKLKARQKDTVVKKKPIVPLKVVDTLI